MLQIKRAYEPARKEDGYRVLVDRLWPRGIRKEGAAIDAWMKDLAPTAELRKWFAHDPARWEGFRERYREELRGERAHGLLEELEARSSAETVTLVYAARDESFNNAVVIRDEVERLRRGRAGRGEGARARAAAAREAEERPEPRRRRAAASAPLREPASRAAKSMARRREPG